MCQMGNHTIIQSTPEFSTFLFPVHLGRTRDKRPDISWQQWFWSHSNRAKPKVPKRNTRDVLSPLLIVRRVELEQRVIPGALRVARSATQVLASRALLVRLHQPLPVQLETATDTRPIAEVSTLIWRFKRSDSIKQVSCCQERMANFFEFGFCCPLLPDSSFWLCLLCTVLLKQPQRNQGSNFAWRHSLQKVSRNTEFLPIPTCVFLPWVLRYSGCTVFSHCPLPLSFSLLPHQQVCQKHLASCRFAPKPVSLESAPVKNKSHPRRLRLQWKMRTKERHDRSKPSQLLTWSFSSIAFSTIWPLSLTWLVFSKSFTSMFVLPKKRKCQQAQTDNFLRHFCERLTVEVELTSSSAAPRFSLPWFVFLSVEILVLCSPLPDCNTMCCLAGAVCRNAGLLYKEHDRLVPVLKIIDCLL